MKKIVLLGSVFMSLFSQAQTFTDNFDSYTAGSYLGPQSAGAWTTWSNTPGGSDDVMVSNADAVSGTNSIHYTSTVQNGGPTDCVHHFGLLNTGQFSMEFNMKVATGAAAYFNLQKTAVMGATYTIDAVFDDAGTLTFTQQSDFSATYPQGTWFNFRLDINFNTNTWEVFFDDVSQGTFSNAENQIESIDIYPVDNATPYNADYFIDDFSTTITPYTLPAVNAGVMNASVIGAGLTGNAVAPTFTIRNLGTSTITAFDIVANYNGINVPQSFSGLSIASLASQTFTMTSTITLVAGVNPLTITVSNVNGAGADGDANDNVKITSLDPVTPAAGKLVVTEEGTGTWCGFCVRGAVFMGRMHDAYDGYWAGLAVHNGDPMTVTDYDAAITAMPGFTGFPTAFVDRVAPIDPADMEASILTRLQVAPKALMTNGATWDAVTRILNVSVTADFQASATNSYKLACALSEDNVTGTVAGYEQHNYYAANAYGPMGGYESLPSVVPATQMVYDHVARAILPSFAGSAAAFPSVINNGDSYTMTFSYDLSANTWDIDKINIISMLIDPSGMIDNAGSTTVAEAVINGYTNSLTTISGSYADELFQVYPNPATTNATVAINLNKESDVSLKIVDMSGKEVAARNYGLINGASTVGINTSNFQSGVYMVELTVNNQKMTKRLIIQ